MRRTRRLELQAKISLVLVAVILPTFLIVTIIENQLTRPVLEEEIKQLAITSAKTLASELVSRRLLQLPNPTPAIEQRLQEFLYAQPNIVRIDVVVKDPATGAPKIIASNVEDESAGAPAVALVQEVTSEYGTDESSGEDQWEISVPIEQRSRAPGSVRKVFGTVHVVASLKLVSTIVGALWKVTATAACFSVAMLILVLNYFLRKTIANERLLRKAETQNLQLAEQLHDAQRQLMNTEKLAVMGQLTASFAHEIGTPLNAIGGHLQLLGEELPRDPASGKAPLGERLDVINGQLARIEQIVKGFLQSTAKPASQRQLVDLNRLVDQTLGLVRPRIESIGVEVKRQLDREMGPLRAVPMDMEQILLNLVNNSLDSLTAKARARERARHLLEVSTQVDRGGDGKEWAVVTVYDSGEGIRKVDLPNVLKPFFTTKRPGEGTGLGLTICQDLARKYGGMLEIDSKEGAWTRVMLRIPYEVSG
jgi:signal transduction histidine kinase